ncbi:MAG: ATP cone domain-containing protein [Patescibacteria group bacterium]|nr:ATP cone domain-containing protein [Patescibacteria group bacterium]
MLPNVIKRDGSVEKFSVINIARVAQAAGLTPEQAKNLAEKMAEWAKQQGVLSLTSLQIRDQILQELKIINQHAADLYTWYEQSKEM